MYRLMFCLAATLLFLAMPAHAEPRAGEDIAGKSRVLCSAERDMVAFLRDFYRNPEGTIDIASCKTSSFKGTIRSVRLYNTFVYDGRNTVRFYIVGVAFSNDPDSGTEYTYLPHRGRDWWH